MSSVRQCFSSELEHRVLTFMRSRCMINQEARVLLAVSGGADSLCLLHLMHRLSAEFPLYLHVAHLDHMLRGGESGADATFVSAQAHGLGVPCIIGSRDTLAHRSARRCSVEEAAREVRYDFLREVAQSCGAYVVMTGHTRDDAVETVMLHLLRGSGIHGLRGLEPVTDFPLPYPGGSDRDMLRLVRPLLPVTRAETLNYCHLLGLNCREDTSNESLDFLRNRVRLEVLPALRQLNPRFDDALLRLADAAVEDDEHIGEAARETWERSVTLSTGDVRIGIREFVDSSPAVQARIIRDAIIHLVGSAQDIAHSHVVSVRSLAAKAPDKQVDLPCGVVWRREEATLAAFRREADPAAAVIRVPTRPVALTVPGETRIPGWRVVATCQERPADVSCEPHVAYLDSAKIGGRLSVRRRRPGDCFRPLGMREEKKLQDFLVDAKVPARFRDSIPVVSSEAHIVWVAGWRIDDRVSVSADTREVVRLEVVPDQA